VLALDGGISSLPRLQTLTSSLPLASPAARPASRTVRTWDVFNGKGAVEALQHQVRGSTPQCSTGVQECQCGAAQVLQLQVRSGTSRSVVGAQFMYTGA